VENEEKRVEFLKPPTDSLTRREFCNKAIRQSSIAAAAGVAGYLTYKKPAVRSFFGTRDAYAATTGPGKFSLTGDSNYGSGRLSNARAVISNGAIWRLLTIPLYEDLW